MTGVYVHLPFCDRICPYCDFAVVEFKQRRVRRYLAALRAEIDRAEPPASLVGSIFVGGGTPSALAADVILDHGLQRFVLDFAYNPGILFGLILATVLAVSWMPIRWPVSVYRSRTGPQSRPWCSSRSASAIRLVRASRVPRVNSATASAAGRPGRPPRPGRESGVLRDAPYGRSSA